jgi:hypothetical protein
MIADDSLFRKLAKSRIIINLLIIRCLWRCRIAWPARPSAEAVAALGVIEDQAPVGIQSYRETDSDIAA